MTLITDMVAGLYDKYEDAYNIPDTDPTVIKLRYWFDPTGELRKPHKQPYDDKVIELYNQGLSDVEIDHKIKRSTTVALRTRHRLGLIPANNKKHKYKLTDRQGVVSEHVSLATIVQAVGYKPNNYSFDNLKKRIEEKGYKLERIKLEQ
ncbi:hypothetical protein FC84_GL001616 [Lapidilactobacillus dextrinicus DSM 20335]|uniref:Uncharacterized protein n=1 Tax=Lapidilactobacillus dextrinicus DSM 20335 TaxID=1423738 RepID=A0A0R2BIT1_9LACO|nr:hypothetical protein [Lapidilactobacillus dextrinicus]KRM79438.1 hypothetical protein FC84_GL001616 [Lapidilactobacillus dextrinicus DSM 20335]QFG46727.1 hypothetical protein LH506_04380 [Lapidilactobacillus dextrinicus]